MDNKDKETFFKQHYRLYKVAKLSDEDAIEFAFFDMKNEFGDDLDLPMLMKIPALCSYLIKHPQGEKSYFHFGRQNSKISQLNAALSQKFI